MISMRPETWLLFAGAIGVDGVIGLSPGAGKGEQNRLEDTISNCTVTGGDTLRCGFERVRLLGIDVPELPGHCRAGRAWAPTDPFASTASLERATSPDMQIARVATDRYGPTLALVIGVHSDLSS